MVMSFDLANSIPRLSLQLRLALRNSEHSSRNAWVQRRQLYQ